MTPPEPAEIGARMRLIRRRGLSLEVAAGLAGISSPTCRCWRPGSATSTTAACSRTWRALGTYRWAIACVVASRVTGRPQPTSMNCSIPQRSAR